MEHILVLRDLWDVLDEPEPALGVGNDEAGRWKKSQKHILAIICLTCEPEVAAMIADATTGKKAWDTLTATYASTNSTNVMRLEEEFGSARKQEAQSMSQWISYMKTLVAQLRGVGIVIPSNKVANRILNGLGDRHESMKYALQARGGELTVELVTDHLLSWQAEADRKQCVQPTTSFRFPPMAGQNNTHRGPMATAMTMSQENIPHIPPATCICQCICGYAASNGHPGRPIQSNGNPGGIQSNGNPGGAIRNQGQGLAQRFSPYGPACQACGKLGHTQNRCWLKFPQLKPQWARDVDTQQGQHPIGQQQATVQTGQPVVQGTQQQPGTIYQPVPLRPVGLEQSFPSQSTYFSQQAHFTQEAGATTSFAFMGPSTEDDNDIAHAFLTVHELLGNRVRFNNEYCFTLRDQPCLMSTRTITNETTLDPLDTPGK